MVFGLGLVYLFLSERRCIGVALYSEHLMQLGIEDCHGRETVLRKISKAFMNQSGQGDRYPRILKVNGLHMKRGVELIAQ